MALQVPGFMLAHDMGTGKSCTAINFAGEIDAKTILIMSPKSVVSVWQPQFDTHASKPYKVIALDTGSVKVKAKTIIDAIDDARILDERLVIVLNYESAWRPPLGPSWKLVNGKNKMVKEGVLMAIHWDLVICDEIHRLKSPGSKVSLFAARLGKKADRRLGLTGTPAPNNLLDVYAQYRFLDPAVFGTSFHRFKKRYAVLGGYENKQVIGFQNVNELNHKFFSIAHKVKSEDVLDLPKVMHEQRICTLSPKCQKIYDSLEKNFIAQIDSGETVSVKIALTKLLRLSQIAGGYVKIDDDTGGKVLKDIVVDDSKIDTVADIMQDLPLKEPMVIFTRFVNEIERLKTLSIKSGRTVCELSGRGNQLKEWQDGKFDDIIIQIQSGGLGVDLTRARICVFFSVGYSLGDFNQALARIHRPGQTRPCIYYHIIARGTVDELVYKSLRSKKKVIDYVLDKLKKN
jgi:SNF2 family DNA or RNA helicase